MSVLVVMIRASVKVPTLASEFGSRAGQGQSLGECLAQVLCNSPGNVTINAPRQRQRYLWQKGTSAVFRVCSATAAA